MFVVIAAVVLLADHVVTYCGYVDDVFACYVNADAVVSFAGSVCYDDGVDVAIVAVVVAGHATAVGIVWLL